MPVRYAIALIVNQLGMLFTGNVNIIGTIAALALIAFMVFMLFKPYKGSEQADRQIRKEVRVTKQKSFLRRISYADMVISKSCGDGSIRSAHRNSRTYNRKSLSVTDGRENPPADAIAAHAQCTEAVTKIGFSSERGEPDNPPRLFYFLL